jgi:WD40 repeat protein
MVHTPQRSVHHLAFSPNGRLLATASNDSTVKVWDIETGEELFVIAGHDAPVTGVAFNQDGTLLVTASADHTVKAWDISKIPTTRVIETPRLTLEHPSIVHGLAMSPSEPLLATAGSDGSIRFFPFPLDDGDIEDLLNLAQTRITD